MLLLLSNSMLFSQKFCGSANDSIANSFSNTLMQAKIKTNNSTEIIYLPVKVHVLLKDNGGGGIDESTIKESIIDANKYFDEALISFYMCGEINYIKNTDIYEDKFLFEAVTDFKVQNFVNLFIVNEMSIVVKVVYPAFERIIDGIGASGKTPYVIVTHNGLKSSEILAHELGHSLTLLHTFGTLHGEKLTDELVDGSNCMTAGDGICDTPADHYLLNKDNSCEPIQGRVDKNGSMFDPLDDNVMAYHTCTTPVRFTRDQMLRMYFYAKMELGNLNCPDSKKYFNPIINIFPNPTANQLNIEYKMLEKSNAKISLLNMLGETVTILKNEVLDEGKYQEPYTLTGILSKGIYLIKTEVNESVFFNKIIYL